MRRKDREIIGIGEKLKIIAKCKICRLGLCENNYPYIVPLNFRGKKNTFRRIKCQERLANESCIFDQRVIRWKLLSDMLAKEIYTHLDNDFIKSGISDDWYRYMTELEPFICDNFKNRDMGLTG